MLHPDDVSLRLRLAELLIRIGRPREAMAHIGAAILLRPASTSASSLLAAHPDFPRYVAMAANKAVRGSANAAARAILGLPTDEPIKTGPAGKQRYSQHGRSIETVAKYLKTAGGAAESKPTRLTLTLSGSDVVGGTVVVPADHKLYAELIALFEKRSAN